jgi:hypothetical protein
MKNKQESAKFSEPNDRFSSTKFNQIQVNSTKTKIKNTMTNSKTERKPGQHHPTAQPGPRRAAAPAPEKQPGPSNALAQACDRLCQKLDEVTGLFREQIEAWRQIQPPAPPAPPREHAPSAEEPARQTPVPATAQAEPMQTHGPGAAATWPPVSAPEVAPLPPPKAPPVGPGIQPGQDARAGAQKEPFDSTPPASRPSAPVENGWPAVAREAQRLVDTVARSGGGWAEQAADAQQALEAIMSFLENQAASAAPKVDVAGILGRLRNLEDQQQELQSQFNISRAA